MTRDYYEVLGVPRDADTQTIKKAYRRLARELHPDVNNHDPDCEEKFKEATRAYEVLCDAEKRRLYDTYGPDAFRRGAGGSGFGGFNGPFGDFDDIFQSFFGSWFGGGAQKRAEPARGQDLLVEVVLDLEEAAFGVTKDVEIEALDTCPECGGAGTADPSSVTTCSVCGGSGVSQTVRQSLLGRLVQTGPCTACRGEGRIIGEPCAACGGAGRSLRARTLSVDIPAGIADGQRVRLTGRGGVGERGGQPGDLYVQVRVAPHPLFQRDGDDILYRQDLTMIQAALGVDLNVPTLDGEEEVHFAAGTQPGDVITLRSRGVPRLRQTGRGAQRILINVVVPRNLDERQRDFLQAFDECCGEEHYNHKTEGFFHKFKQLFTG
ncbi:MAG: molecular chaperone DnaJ [Actinobacteria bacterium]|nr:molecular chaperone DnaJ [Actinomycetota bacterium]